MAGNNSSQFVTAIEEPKRAKQKTTMARKRSAPTETQSIVDSYFPPERIMRLMLGIKSALSLAESRPISLEDLEQLSGRPVGTIGSWLEGARMLQLEFLFALLERLPTDLRHVLVNSVCRTQPSLRHPRLAHDPIATSRLESLLKQTAGFTLIHGGPEHVRGFLLNAMGNSSREVNAGQQAVYGVDLVVNSTWAPVPGMIQLSPHSEFRPQFERAFSHIEQAKESSLILLGPIWNRALQSHSKLIQLAGRCHVVVADEVLKPEELLRRVPGPVHLVTVTPAREQPEWIRVTIQPA